MGGDRLVRHWFEHWVDEQPDHLAVTGDDGGHLTYAQLEEVANRIGNLIEDLDPAAAFPTAVVALDQSTDAVVAIVAASKTGRTIVPLGVAAPPGRVAETLAQLPPAVVLTRASDQPSLAAVPLDRALVLRVDDLPDGLDARRRERPLDLDGTWVVQFTSGSTGVPKGVPRPNRAAVAALRRRQREDRLGPDQRVALTSDFQWAAGWGTVTSALCTGSSLHRHSTRRRGAGDLLPWLREERITSWTTIPSLVQAALEASPGVELPDLRHVHLSGDVLHRATVEALFRLLPPDAEVGNHYGSSEMGGVAGLLMERDAIPAGDPLPVGAPNRGVEVAIADPDADGFGEVVVTSRRGASSYLGADPSGFRISDAGDGRSTYRTGDVGRLRPDGLLELRGRSDRMVKVRGHRVDLTEVEVALRHLPQVREAAVDLHHPVDGPPRIVAWVASEPGGDVSVPTLRRLLRERLPGYMVPVAFVAVDALPRTTRGKLDRRALVAPAAGRPDLGHPFEAPAGSTEEAVAGAFAHVLGVSPVGRHDAFFDLGGDSLHAAEVMTMVAAVLGRDLPLSVFLEADTPAALAARFDEVRAGQVERLVTLQSEGDGPTLYCVHGGGGQVLSFAGLGAGLRGVHPFVGIQMSTSDRARDLFSVRRLARRYRDEILRHGGGAPCVVAGHSYGGVVAFELAAALRASGVDVRACVILDGPVPDRRLLFRLVPASRSVVGDSTKTVKWKELAYAAHALLGLRPKPHRLTTERMQAGIWGMLMHRPRPTDVPVVVVKALDGPPGRDLAGWGRFTSGGCTVVDVPGDHHSILTPPHLHRLVDDLLAALGATTPATP